MKLTIKARNIPVPANLQEHIETRLGKLDRYLDSIQDLQVDLQLQHTKQGDRAVVQTTARAERHLLRAEVTAEDFLTAVDQVTERMQRQIVRYKERAHSPRGRTGRGDNDTADRNDLEDEEEEQQGIVRVKRFVAKPMTEDEAIEQMELIGHTFFVFRNASDERFCVLYKRSHGGYGMLEPGVG